MADKLVDPSDIDTIVVAVLQFASDLDRLDTAAITRGGATMLYKRGEVTVQ